MLKTVKRLGALLLALTICLGLAACHKQGEIAVRADGVEFTSAFYSCALLAADMQAQEIMAERYESTSTTLNNAAWLDKTIDEVPYVEWVEKRALDTIKEMVVAKKLCEENKIDTAKYFELADQNAEYLWSYGYADFFTQNGVSFNTYKEFSRYEQYSTAYFDFLYGEGGEKAVSKEELKTFADTNYAYLNIYAEDITNMSEDEMQVVKEELESYKAMLESGKTFTEVYAKATDTEYKADSTDTGNFSHSLATIWGATGTSYENNYFENTKEMAKGEIKIVTLTEEDATYAVLILKGDITGESNTNIETVYSAARTDLKGEEFDAFITEKVEAVNLETVKYAVNQFKVKKIKFPAQ